jgi:hypothetical protein
MLKNVSTDIYNNLNDKQKNSDIVIDENDMNDEYEYRRLCLYNIIRTFGVLTMLSIIGLLVLYSMNAPIAVEIIPYATTYIINKYV